jgi:hypothetical protein
MYVHTCIYTIHAYIPRVTLAVPYVSVEGYIHPETLFNDVCRRCVDV